MAEQDFDLITTRGGDRGESSLYSGERYRKDDLFFECLGDLDELGSVLGVCRAALDRRASGYRPASPQPGTIEEIQKTLQRLSAAVATEPAHPLRTTFRSIDETDVESLERAEKALLMHVRIAVGFVLPGRNERSAACDWARAVARRTERRIVAVIRDKGRPDLHACQRYLNRLSDYLFICARFFDQEA
jgi:cob(I)alamin adenosyltransferase